MRSSNWRASCNPSSMFGHFDKEGMFTSPVDFFWSAMQSPAAITRCALQKVHSMKHHAATLYNQVRPGGILQGCGPCGFVSGHTLAKLATLSPAKTPGSLASSICLSSSRSTMISTLVCASTHSSRWHCSDVQLPNLHKSKDSGSRSQPCSATYD
jgi:hypothetical protein